MGAGIFINNRGELRSGWKILAFFLLFFIFQFSFIIVLGDFIQISNIKRILIEISFLVSVAISTYLMMRLVDKRSFFDVGLRFEGKAHLLIFWGIIIGFAMISIVVLLNVAFGNYRYMGLSNDFNLTLLFKVLFLFVLVAFAEELFFRGYPFQRLIDGVGKFLAVVLFSVVFALAHLGNPNVSYVAILNIFLAGVWLSVAYIKTGSLWFPISLHFSWNFFQGWLYSLPVSGVKFAPMFGVDVRGSEIISGGNFGPEGSIITSFVLVAFTVFILRSKKLT